MENNGSLSSSLPLNSFLPFLPHSLPPSHVCKLWLLLLRDGAHRLHEELQQKIKDFEDVIKKSQHLQYNNKSFLFFFPPNCSRYDFIVGMSTYDFIVGMCTYDFIVRMSTVPITLLWWANQSDSLHTPKNKKKPPKNHITNTPKKSQTPKNKLKTKSCPFS
jgi:hypothetical protein